MSKKQSKQKKWEYIFIGLVAVLVILLIVSAVLPKNTAADGTLTITEDGHVHTADGTHLGTYEEIFGTALEGGVTDGTEEAAADEGETEEAADEEAVTEETVTEDAAAEEPAA